MRHPGRVERVIEAGEQHVARRGGIEGELVRGGDAPQPFARGHAPKERLIVADRQNRRGRLRSEEHTSELQSLMRISYAVFCLKKKKKQNTNTNTRIDKTKQNTH